MVMVKDVAAPKPPEKITVAAAIRRIKKLKGEIGTLDARIKNASVYEEGKNPAFSFDESIASRRDKVIELMRLQTKVSISNASTVFLWDGSQVVVAYAIRYLQEIKSEAALLAALPIRERVRDVMQSREAEWNDEAEKSVFVVKQTVHISEMSKVEQARQIERLTGTFETLNTALEACNHETFITLE